MHHTEHSRAVRERIIATEVRKLELRQARHARQRLEANRPGADRRQAPTSATHGH